MRNSWFVPFLLIAFIVLLVGLSVGIVYYRLNHQAVSAEIRRGVEQVIQSSPQLRPMYESAMEDETLTMVEANKIIAAAEDQKAALSGLSIDQDDQTQ
ncbi:MAG: hypothetical protein AB8G99_14805 [Planctomycetaceae bacterium]